MFCSGCGFKMPDGVTNCPNCGKQVAVKFQNQPYQQQPYIMQPQPVAIPQQKKKNHAGLIIGCVAGGIGLLILIIVLVVLITSGSDNNTSFADIVTAVEDANNTANENIEDDKPQFTWYKEPYLAAEDMQVINGSQCTDLDTELVAFYEAGFCGLIDSEGNIVRDAVYTDVDYCETFNGITFNSHFKIFYPETGIMEEHGGHGGYSHNFYYDINAQKYDYVYSEAGYTESLYYDKSGAYVVESAVKNTQYDSYFYYNGTGKYGLYNDGEMVLPCEFEMTSGISAGVVGMYDGSQWSYYTTEGKLIRSGIESNGQKYEWYKIIATNPYESVQTSVDRIYSFSCGCVPLKIDGKWGYMDKNGEMIIDAQFEKALPAFENRAWVCVDGLWGIINIEK